MARPDDWSALDLASDPVPVDPLELEERAAHGERLSERAGEQVERFERLVDRGSDLNGTYALAFRQSCARTGIVLYHLHWRYAVVSEALRGLLGPLDEARTVSAQALETAREARRLQSEREDDADSTPNLFDGVVDTLHEATIEAAQAQCARAVQTYDEAAQTAAAAMRQAAEATDSQTLPSGVGAIRRFLDKAALLDTDTIPSEILAGFDAAMTPEQAARWWESLTEAEREYLIRYHPEMVGPVDGLPYAARSRANPILLDEYDGDLRDELAAVTEELENLEPDQPYQYDNHLRRVELLERAEVLRHKIDQIDDLRTTLNREERHLVHLEITDENVLSAVASGDLDSAEYVSTFVGGTGSNGPGTMASYDDLVDGVRQRSIDLDERRGGSGEVAMVTWLGYDAPSEIFTLGSENGANWRWRSEDGGARLADFQQGLDAVRSRTDGPLPTTSIVAHSYGTPTTGSALTRDFNVDNVVMMGPAGTGPDIADLQIDAGQISVLRTDDDAVPPGFHGQNPITAPGVNRLSTSGSDWGDASFGHGLGEGYLGDGSTAQHNVAATVLDRPGLRVDWERDYGRVGINAP